MTEMLDRAPPILPSEPCYIEPDLAPFGRKVFSQNDEDGILEKLAAALRIEKGTFVEFGVGPPWQSTFEKDGLEANCRLLHERGWTGLWMDGNPETDLVKKEFITALNINELLAKHGFAFDVDVFSIDVDGQDFWIWMNLATRPKIVIIEYNRDFEPHESQVVPFDTSFVWDCTRYMGASLGAVCKLARSKNYRPVYANGVNAVFVREDLLLNKRDFPNAIRKPRERLHGDDPLNRPWVTI